MDIKTLLPASHVIMDFAAASRREAWERLCEQLAAAKIITDPGQFLEDLERREDEVTTRIDELVALPHARSNAVRRLGVIMGLSPDRRIVYNGDEQGPAVLFLIAIPAFAPAAHLPVLQHFARFVHDPTRLRKLLAASSPAQAARLVAGSK
jgi:mannitol/fructose-specific phosphotransferase system IIA component (Ntr-type)